MDEKLSEKLYETHYMRVYSFLISLTGNKDLAEELTQETFFKALSSRSGYRGEADELTWLCSIARNLYFDERRRQSRFSDSPAEPGADEDFRSAAEDRDLSFRIHLILHGLGEPYREVFELRVFGELSFSEIARIFGKSESWARVTFHRAKLQIRERMADSQHDS